MVESNGYLMALDPVGARAPLGNLWKSSEILVAKTNYWETLNYLVQCASLCVLVPIRLNEKGLIQTLFLAMESVHWTHCLFDAILFVITGTLLSTVNYAL